MKVHDVLADQDKLVYAFADKKFDQVPFQCHDVVVDGIIPFADQLNDGEAQIVVGV
jgi:hypothetical protein